MIIEIISMVFVVCLIVSVASERPHYAVGITAAITGTILLVYWIGFFGVWLWGVLAWEAM